MSERELDRLDRLDRLILNSIQSDFPVAARPYAELARRLGAAGENLTEAELWTRVRALKHDGFIRRLGAVFNAGPLGYRSTLCAARVPADRVEDFSHLVGRAPQVTHNYLRSGELNAWFTFTSDRPGDLADFLEHLKREGGAEDIQVLEAEKLFKIKVDFHLPEKG